MKIDEFNKITEKLIKQLNEEADPLSPSQDPDDIDKSLAAKVKKADIDLRDAYNKVKMTDPSTKTGQMTRIMHKVKKAEAEAAENKKRKFSISDKLSKIGMDNGGILEGLSDMAKEFDSEITNTTEDFFNNEVKQEEPVDLYEGIIQNIKNKITDKKNMKKAKEAKVKLDSAMSNIDDINSEIRKAKKEISLLKQSNKKSDIKKIEKLDTKISELTGTLNTLKDQYSKANNDVASFEQKGYLEENIDLESLLEEINNLKKDVKEVVDNVTNANNKPESDKVDIDIPSEITKPTGDSMIDKTIATIVKNINNEKAKQNPDIIKIKKLIAKIKSLRE